jgi:hypothetical protein
MAAFDTTADDVDDFAATIARVVAGDRAAVVA